MSNHAEKKELFSLALKYAEEMSFYCQIEEMLVDLGADPSFYTKLKEEL